MSEEELMTNKIEAALRLKIRAEAFTIIGVCLIVLMALSALIGILGIIPKVWAIVLSSIFGLLGLVAFSCLFMMFQRMDNLLKNQEQK